MSLEITSKIDVTKILKEHLYQGKQGKYLDLAYFSNKDGKDKYENDGFIVQGLSKEARENGEKGPIIGNWRYHESKGDKPKPKPAPAPAADEPEPDIPF